MIANNYVSGCGCMCHIPGFIGNCLCTCNSQRTCSPQSITITSSSIDQKRLSDIESRLHEMEGKIEHLYDGVTKCHERIDSLHEHKNMQIDENRKISRRVDEICFDIELLDKKNNPHKCPVCNGFASMFVNKNTAEGPRLYHQEKNPCHACKGTGIIWS